MLVGEGTELSIGEKNYAPMRQSEGGDYALDPALTNYVQRVGNRLAAVSDRKLPYEFVVLNNTIPNAWALPGGKIAVNRGLLVQLKSESELAAVLGHEIVHAAARHSAQQMSRGMLLQGGLLAAQVASSDSDYGNLYMAGAGLGAQLLMQRYSREAELEADKYGIEYMSKAGYDVQGAVTLQETFVRMSANKDSNWFAGSVREPSALAGARRRESQARGQVSGRRRNGHRGLCAPRIAPTLKSKPAYDAYDEGRKALKDKHADVALAKADQAIKLVPDEGHFYALRGDAYLRAEEDCRPRRRHTRTPSRATTSSSITTFSAASSPSTSGRTRKRARDLETSLKLLPTGAAYYALGNIASRARNPDAARQYYAAAAGSEGEIGQAASLELMRLELPQNPGKYIRAQAGLDSRGMLVVAIGNPTRVPVAGLSIAVQYVDAQGRSARRAPRLQRHAGGGTAGAGCDGSRPVPERRPVQGRDRVRTDCGVINDMRPPGRPEPPRRAQMAGACA